MMLRLGIIGMSDGNGHPYSWSAICNGYDAAAMAQCEYPVIPRYLGEKAWPEARLQAVQVTHVWTQNRALSQRIARCSLIKHVVDRPEHMIGHIDGLLLARDDARNHAAFAEPFLQAGLPVYVDKPIALSLQALDRLHAMERFPGQIFSCSALRYADELRPHSEALQDLGKLRLIIASTPKDWERYAIHLIDPILMIVGIKKPVKRLFCGSLTEGGRTLGLAFQGGPDVLLMAMGRSVHASIEIRLQGEQSEQRLVFGDTFRAFRAALSAFRDQVLEPSQSPPPAFNQRAVEMLEMGVS